MKKIIQSNPIISYLLIAYLITFSFWFAPSVFNVALDIKFGLFIVGGCGPLLAAYLVMLVQSERKIEIPSLKLFLFFFLLSFFSIALLMYSIELGNIKEEGFTPRIENVSILGWLLLLLFCFITGLNASNAANQKLKENYLKTFLFDKSKLKWYVIAVLLFPILSILGYFLGDLLGFKLTEFFIKYEPFWILTFLGTFLYFGGNEEFGWRGFMQKELQKKYSPLISALLISVAWNFWHLPMHYNGIYSTGGIADLLPRFLLIIPHAIMLTWLFNKSKYSLLAVVLLHTMHNSFTSIFGGARESLFILQMLFCVIVIVKEKMWIKVDFSKESNN